MAFSSRDLSVIGYANGFTFWHFRTSDPARRVGAANYFNTASHMLRVGDFVIVNAGIGNNPAHGLVVVVAIDQGDVQIRQLAAIPGLANNKTRDQNFAL